jgi:hypothetical protein
MQIEIISIISLSISILTAAFVALSYLRDQPKLHVTFSLMLSSDFSEKFIRVKAANIGRRRVSVKDIGTVSWSFGNYSVGAGKDLWVSLGEAESTEFDIPYNSDSELADIRKIGARDHHNKVWFVKDEEMESLFSHLYGKRSKSEDKFIKKFSKDRTQSLGEYLQFIKDRGYDNKLKRSIGVAFSDKNLPDDMRREFEYEQMVAEAMAQPNGGDQ